MGDMTMQALPTACAVRLEATDAEDALRRIAALAVEAGHAEPTFPDALVRRELAYPTGLPTAVAVAIPHADPTHVREAGFAVATLARPVSFGVMGTADETIDVDVVIALLVTEAHAQVEVLTTLVDIVQRDGWETTLRAAETPERLAAAFDALLTA